MCTFVDESSQLILFSVVNVIGMVLNVGIKRKEEKKKRKEGRKEEREREETRASTEMCLQRSKGQKKKKKSQGMNGAVSE